MHALNRVVTVVVAVAALILAAGLYRQAGWAMELYPWQDGRLSHIFVASIVAAFAGSMLWVGLARDFSGLKAVARNAFVSLAAGGLAVAIVGARDDSGRALLVGILAGSIALIFLAVVIWTYHTPFADKRPLPNLVRVSFAVFCVALVLTSTALLLRAEHIFPWPLKPESSVVFGCLFIGSAIYFAYGVLRPVWSNGYGQLAGFLVYDLVLIVPFVQHFDDVQSDHRLSLILYVAVLLYSGLLAIYYLFANPATRLWRRHTAPFAPDPMPIRVAPR